MKLPWGRRRRRGVCVCVYMYMQLRARGCAGKKGDEEDTNEKSRDNWFGFPTLSLGKKEHTGYSKGESICWWGRFCARALEKKKQTHLHFMTNNLLYFYLFDSITRSDDDDDDEACGAHKGVHLGESPPKKSTVETFILFFCFFIHISIRAVRATCPERVCWKISCQNVYTRERETMIVTRHVSCVLHCLSGGFCFLIKKEGFKNEFEK